MVAASNYKQKVSAQYGEVELHSKLEGADPYTLVKILYEELEKCFLVLQAVSNRGGNITRHSYANRAHSIILALLGGLNDVKDSNLSFLLADVYRSMAQSINVMNQNGDASQLVELLDGIASLKSAWDQIPAMASQKQS